ncbi:alpha/beta fold hydrolase [Streptomyces parvus]|uniref:alpha/beta fold hydrolase n=1 Tax=Streptomyces TaxID=1883 RepID=UPI000C27126A|nr:alpha/beta fold hydrolase [Streptomyces sp. CB02613]PJN33069.1 alpha/beta hydrolase [Streptomyces sp. CB02613]
MGIDDSTYVHGIHVVHDGPREAPPLVLVHGSGASGSSWGPVVPVLARRHHVIRVDLPGHGQSPPAASYDVPGQAAVLRALIAPPLGPLMWRVRSDAMLRRGVTAVCSRPVTVPDDLVDDVRDISYRTFRTVLRRNTEYIAERSVPTRLGALDVPALVVFGTADPRWDPDAVRLYDGTPNTRVERLAGVGHFPMLEAPAETGESLLRFLAAAGRRAF